MNVSNKGNTWPQGKEDQSRATATAALEQRLLRGGGPAVNVNLRAGESSSAMERLQYIGNVPDDLQQRRSPWISSQQQQVSGAAASPDGYYSASRSLPALMQHQRQLRMPGTQGEEQATSECARILQRLDAIAREEQEIAVARARILERERRRNHHQHQQHNYYLPSDDDGSGSHSQVDRWTSAHYISTLTGTSSTLGLLDSSRLPTSAGLVRSLRQQGKLAGDTGEEGLRLRSSGAHIRGVNVGTPKSSEKADDQENETSVQDNDDDEQETGGPLVKRSTMTATSRETFPRKLHRLLNEAEQDGNSHIVSWMPHGMSFIVHKPKEFVEMIMPRYFPGSKKLKKNSFDKQLNLYQFKRISTGEDKGGYFHCDFIRHKPDLCKRIKRKNTNGSRPPPPPPAAIVATGTGRYLPVSSMALCSPTQLQEAHSRVSFPQYPEQEGIRTTALPNNSTQEGRRLDWLAEAISKSRHHHRNDIEATTSTSKTYISAKQEDADQPPSPKFTTTSRE